ncbi:MAG TPA: hypothetical protein VNT51_13090, partial [Miltoncostaeaceae bacterium]|nr:hypothetical protein [Miltoncostaeaceae bacterium]
MNFFDRPPPGGDEQEDDAAEAPLPWEGPPQGVLGGLVPVQRVIAHGPGVLMAVTGVRAYPEGLGFRLEVVREGDGDGDGEEPWPFLEDDESTALGVGVVLTDGSVARNLAGLPVEEG